MLHLRQQATANSAKQTTAATHIPAVSGEVQKECVDVEHPRIAAHLDGILGRLGGIPAQDREEIRRELRVHLDSLVAANEELGATWAEAVEAAAVQFGDTRRIAQRYRRAWTQTFAYVSPWPATRLAFFTFGAGLLSLLGPMLHILSLIGPHQLPQWAMFKASVLFAALLIVPIIAGAWVGARAPCRAAVGSFFALGALALLTVPMLLMDNGEYVGQAPTYLKIAQQIAIFLGAYVGETCILWMPIGCLAAAIPGVARTLRRRRITAK